MVKTVCFMLYDFYRNKKQLKKKGESTIVKERRNLSRNQWREKSPLMAGICIAFPIKHKESHLEEKGEEGERKELA